MLLLSQRSWGFPASGIAVFILSISVRPENIIYVFIFAAYFLITARLALMRSLIALGVAFGVYFVRTQLSHNYGWAILSISRSSTGP